ncbi:hypothetical protein DL990_33250 [Amycolatopsis sp. WAC 01416]|uniref:hypothetical protein n=1 Tax=Amycolatopsis sp. WAC 01416 TaxID=2203196 RepID=UPI000F772BDE|nr:hypothetical protein [Amycolatopsis sp. WAC 01416]RSN24761.1 hypothetical protein DL990_33250 [Amycolatopsis sp. WAC 01416]
MGEFDFLVGSWNVLNRRLTKRLAGSDDWVEFTAPAKSWSLFEGKANVDEIVFPDGVRGLTLRLFDPVARKWSLNWSSSDTGRLFPPVIGEFTDGRGVFYGEDTEGDTPVRVRFIWSDVTENSARWEQAFSIDNGESWEVNWIMTFNRS